MLVTRPADPCTSPLLEKTAGLGTPKLARFKILKTSARKSSLNRSVTDISLTKVRSKSAKLGPVTVFRPRLP